MTLKYLIPPNLFEIIDAAGIATTKQIITLSIWDFKKYTNMSTDDILLVKNIVCENVCPSITTCDILKKEKAAVNSRVTTGCPAIDNMLKGGLRRGTITEIFGESGCGKTQLALQISLSNWAGGSVFICTEDLFPTKRFEEMKKGLPDYDSSIDYGNKIFIKHVTEANDLLSSVKVRLPKLLEQNALSVIIIDSIAAPFRCESINYVKRAEDLREIAILLTTIAQQHNLAVLCVNQVTACFDDTAPVLPSLGLAWSNMVATRLMIEKTRKTVYNTSSYVRQLSTVFAPDLPNDKVEFVVTSRGIQDFES